TEAYSRCDRPWVTKIECLRSFVLILQDEHQRIDEVGDVAPASYRHPRSFNSQNLSFENVLAEIRNCAFADLPRAIHIELSNHCCIQLVFFRISEDKLFSTNLTSRITTTLILGRTDALVGLFIHFHRISTEGFAGRHVEHSCDAELHHRL